MTLVDDFQADCCLRNIGTSRIYRLYAQEFCSFLESRDKEPAQVSREDLKAFLLVIRGRNMKTASQEKVFSVISQFYEYMLDEDLIQSNPIPPFRKRYLRQFKDDNGREARQLISVDQAAMLLNSILKSRDKALLALLFKTGMRRGELCSLDVGDVDMAAMSLVLKPTAKRTNRLLFFDQEAARILQAWMNVRPKNRGAALFPSTSSGRISPQEVGVVTEKYAARVGLHDPKSKNLQERFTPHCCRHWFTTHLRRAGMPREFIQELRGDVRRDAIDTYDHIDEDELKVSYLAHIPQLGI
ncbi:MAG: tyrosine-type recombinase/integrase [Methanothrix sp.]